MKDRVQDNRIMSIYIKFVNAFLLVLIAILTWYFMPFDEKIGFRDTLALNFSFVAFEFFFMTMMEKYSAWFSDFHEKTIINILSTLYSFIIAGLLNVILFSSQIKLMSDLVLTAASLILITCFDQIICLISKNSKVFRVPRMFIMNSDNETLMRMKRIKYGALNLYDSWYEKLEGVEFDKFKEIVEENFPKFDAICILNGLTQEQYTFAVKTAKDLKKDLFIVPEMIDAGITSAKIVRFDDVLALHMPKTEITQINIVLKRFFDIVLSLIGTVIAAIPMLLIAAAIKLTSPGPVFYKQERLTKNKKKFMIYKFRTMIPDAEKLTGPMFAEKNDPRITKIGKLLRACRLDELPQLLNILKGDMSIVGPRPERPNFVEQFEQEIQNYDYRFAVKAGLTSLSHVYGRYSTYIHDRTYYDLYYISDYSLWLDFKIILLTSKTMFIKSAAEGTEIKKEKSEASNKEGVVKL